MAVEAQFPGICKCCGDDIEEGDEISYSEMDGGWVLTDHLGIEDG